MGVLASVMLGGGAWRSKGCAHVCCICVCAWVWGLRQGCASMGQPAGGSGEPVTLRQLCPGAPAWPGLREQRGPVRGLVHWVGVPCVLPASPSIPERDPRLRPLLGKAFPGASPALQPRCWPVLSHLPHTPPCTPPCTPGFGIECMVYCLLCPQGKGQQPTGSRCLGNACSQSGCRGPGPEQGWWAGTGHCCSSS